MGAREQDSRASQTRGHSCYIVVNNLSIYVLPMFSKFE